MSSFYSNMSLWFCWLLWALLHQSLFCYGSGRQRTLCGKPLADTLDTLCAGRGFHMGKRNGRSIGSVYGKQAVVKGKSSGHLFESHHPYHNYIHHISNNDNNDDNSNYNNNNINMNDNNNNNRNYKTNHHSQGLPSIGDQGLSYFKQKRHQLVNFLSNVGVTRPYNYTQEYLRRLAAVQFHDSHESSPEELALLNGALVTPSFRRRRRQAETMNIVEECCLRPCGIRTLLSYCATADEPEIDWPEHIVRQFFGMSTARPTTTQRPQAVGPERPPAQINRGAGRPQYDFFYVETENQATRSPLLVDREQQQQQQS